MKSWRKRTGCKPNSKPLERQPRTAPRLSVGGRPLPEGNGPMETIRLYRSEHVWIADFGEDGLILSALGTSEIPLPFTRNASPAVVMAHVIERNPDAEIFIDFIGERSDGQPSPVQMFIETVSESPSMYSERRAARNEGPGMTPAPLVSAKITVAEGECGHCAMGIKA